MHTNERELILKDKVSQIAGPALEVSDSRPLAFIRG